METKTEDHEFAAACIEKYKVREKDLITPIHAAAYACDPECIDHKQVTLTDHQTQRPRGHKFDPPDDTQPSPAAPHWIQGANGGQYRRLWPL
jgi:hypothetical protein